MVKLMFLDRITKRNSNAALLSIGYRSRIVLFFFALHKLPDRLNLCRLWWKKCVCVCSITVTYYIDWMKQKPLIHDRDFSNFYGALLFCLISVSLGRFTITKQLENRKQSMFVYILYFSFAFLLLLLLFTSTS